MRVACKVAIDAEEKLWKTFDTHLPEGLNQAGESARNCMVKINYPRNNRRDRYIYGSAMPTHCGTYHSRHISYATPEDLFAARALAWSRYFYVANFIQERVPQSGRYTSDEFSNTAAVTAPMSTGRRNGWLGIPIGPSSCSPGDIIKLAARYDQRFVYLYRRAQGSVQRQPDVVNQ